MEKLASQARVGMGPGNAGKYLNFSLAFSRTQKSLKMDLEVLENPGICKLK